MRGFIDVGVFAVHFIALYCRTEEQASKLLPSPGDPPVDDSRRGRPAVMQIERIAGCFASWIAW